MVRLYLKRVHRIHQFQYAGDIIHIQTFGKHVIYLNSWAAVKDLLRKRSAIYSDRPRMVMMAEM